MVTTVDSAEAGRDWSKLLDRVEQGEQFVIQRSGNPIAQLVPVSRDAPRRPFEETLRIFRDLRKRTVPTTLDEIREMINEGRP
jgi:prevent-host-death family protein